MKVFVAVIRDAVSSGMITCNCGVVCAGTCTWAEALNALGVHPPEGHAS